MKSPGEYSSERQAFIDAATAKLKAKLLPLRDSPIDRMMHDLEHVIASVLAMSRPIQQAGGALKPDDILALRNHVFTWTLEAFDKWDKETMCMLTTTFIAERIMQQIESDPWAAGKPEGLSGV